MARLGKFLTRIHLHVLVKRDSPHFPLNDFTFFFSIRAKNSNHQLSHCTSTLLPSSNMFGNLSKTVASIAKAVTEPFVMPPVKVTHYTPLHLSTEAPVMDDIFTADAYEEYEEFAELEIDEPAVAEYDLKYVLGSGVPYDETDSDSDASSEPNDNQDNNDAALSDSEDFISLNVNVKKSNAKPVPAIKRDADIKIASSDVSKQDPSTKLNGDVKTDSTPHEPFIKSKDNDKTPSPTHDSSTKSDDHVEATSSSHDLSFQSGDNINTASTHYNLPSESKDNDDNNFKSISSDHITSTKHDADTVSCDHSSSTNPNNGASDQLCSKKPDEDIKTASSDQIPSYKPDDKVKTASSDHSISTSDDNNVAAAQSSRDTSSQLDDNVAVAHSTHGTSSPPDDNNVAAALSSHDTSSQPDDNVVAASPDQIISQSDDNVAVARSSHETSSPSDDTKNEKVPFIVPAIAKVHALQAHRTVVAKLINEKAARRNADLDHILAHQRKEYARKVEAKRIIATARVMKAPNARKSLSTLPNPLPALKNLHAMLESESTPPTPIKEKSPISTTEESVIPSETLNQDISATVEQPTKVDEADIPSSTPLPYERSAAPSPIHEAQEAVLTPHSEAQEAPHTPTIHDAQEVLNEMEQPRAETPEAPEHGAAQEPPSTPPGQKRPRGDDDDELAGEHRAKNPRLELEHSAAQEPPSTPPGQKRPRGDDDDELAGEHRAKNPRLELEKSANNNTSHEDTVETSAATEQATTSDVGENEEIKEPSIIKSTPEIAEAVDNKTTSDISETQESKDPVEITSTIKTTEPDTTSSSPEVLQSTAPASTLAKTGTAVEATLDPQPSASPEPKPAPQPEFVIYQDTGMQTLPIGNASTFKRCYGRDPEVLLNTEIGAVGRGRYTRENYQNDPGHFRYGQAYLVPSSSPASGRSTSSSFQTVGFTEANTSLARAKAKANIQAGNLQKAATAQGVVVSVKGERLISHSSAVSPAVKVHRDGTVSYDGDVDLPMLFPNLAFEAEVVSKISVVGLTDPPECPPVAKNGDITWGDAKAPRANEAFSAGMKEWEVWPAKGKGQ
ncbi:unnamed protein product [Periconia digitata]|uniref:Uncharacterized protein n=1 Tax=Periconia digitata TaxID=1303443 RepID=A0A9W4U980_9PLEO|nr:unnamed protein product [Periconia digitata]